MRTRTKNLIMGKPLLAAAALGALLLPGAEEAWALGTSAGTVISNSALVTYSVAGVAQSVNTIPAVTTVDELVNVNVTWQDAAPVTVSSPDSRRVATFRVTNTGNGTESFNLAASSPGGPQFDPAFVNMYVDNGDLVFDSSVDTLYAGAVNLAADTARVIFVRNDIPGGRTDGDLGDTRLTATSTHGTGAAGTSIAGAGDGGTDLVFGASTGTANATGTYRVLLTALTMTKGQTVTDPWGGSEPVPQAVISYLLTVTVTGSGTADGVTVTDSIPANTAFVSGSLRDRGNPQPDPGAGVVTINMGNLSAGTYTIAFQVTIQ